MNRSSSFKHLKNEEDAGFGSDDGSVMSTSVQSTGVQEAKNLAADQNVKKDAKSAIAAKESKAVRWIRILAIAVIVSSTLGVALAVFYYMTNTERDTFKYRFKSDSYKILESIGSTFDRSLGSVDSFAVSMVSTAKQSNQTWPFVVMSDFPVKSSKILALSKGVLFTTYSYVTPEERPLWSNFSTSHDEWVEESLDVQEAALNKTYFGPINRNWTKPAGIYGDHGLSTGPDMSCPAWQQFPVIPIGYPSYGWDYSLYMDVSGQRMVETHQPTISSAFHLPDPDNPDEVAWVELSAEYYRGYLPPNRDPYEPFSDVLYVRTTFGAVLTVLLSATHIDTLPLLESHF
jgi:hypothetical protein